MLCRSILLLLSLSSCCSFQIGSFVQHNARRAPSLQNLCMAQSPAINRRSALTTGLRTGLLPLIAPAIPALADGPTEFTDKERGFTVKIPAGETQTILASSCCANTPVECLAISRHVTSLLCASPCHEDINIAKFPACNTRM